MDHPTFGQQFEIDQAAQRIIRDILEKNWLVRVRDRPDVFVDYEIELRTRGEPTGKTAYIQLKGQASITTDGSSAKLVMETKHLRHYLEAVRLPMFVVLVDVSTRRAFYLFTQRWLAGQSAESLAKQQTMTLSLPLVNDLNDFPAFLTTVNSAISHMSDRYPGRPEAAVASLERQYRQLDNRFDVRVSATSSGRRVELSAIDPVEVTMRIEGITADKMTEIARSIEWGKPFSAENVNLSVKGSPLLEHLNADLGQKGQMGWTPAIIAPFIFEFHTSLRGKPVVLSLPSKMTTGTKGVSFELDEPDCPFTAELQLFLEKPEEGVRGRIKIAQRPEAWAGRDLLTAPRFHEVTSVFAAIGAGQKVQIKVISLDRRIQITTPRKKMRSENLRHIWEWCLLLADGAKVARRYGIAPKIPHPRDLTDVVIADLSFAYETLTSRTVRRAWITVHYKHPIPEMGEIIRGIKGPGEVQGAFTAAFPCEIRVFDAVRSIGLVELGPALCRLTAANESDPELGKMFKVLPVKGKSVVLAIRQTGRDEPILGLQPGEFRFDPDGLVGQ